MEEKNVNLDTIGKRLNFARKQLGKSFNDLAVLIGGTNANAVGSAFRNNTVKTYFINIICEKLVINKEWVLTGKGAPFTEAISVIELKQIAYEEFMEAKYLPITAQAGYLTSLEGNGKIELQKILVPKEFNKGNYLVAEIDGASMDDGTNRSICDGDKLLLKQLELNNGDRLPYRNNLFVIVSKEGIVCKQIINQNLENGNITCHSFNNLYEDYDINLRDVYYLFLVKKIVERRVKL